MMMKQHFYNIWRSSLALLAFTLLLFPGTISAQDKIEREYAIKTSQVPEKALQFVDEVFDDERIRWYAEESQKGRSIEAKVKQDGTIYSIEFDEAGKLQDIEMLISFRSMPEKLRVAIEKTFNAEFSRIKINKVQRQWTGPARTLQALIAKEKTEDKYTTRYEMIIRGTDAKGTADYEMLVDDQGTLLRKSKIIQKDTPHLLF